jgi:hypothetical protein
MPLLAVMVMVLLPSGVAAVVEIVRVAVFAVASLMMIGVGLKLALAPDGKPLAVRFTGPVNPARGVIVTVYCALAPGITARADGVAVITKSGVVDAGADATKVR